MSGPGKRGCFDPKCGCVPKEMAMFYIPLRKPKKGGGEGQSVQQTTVIGEGSVSNHPQTEDVAVQAVSIYISYK
jgi:hypothetical protein